MAKAKKKTTKKKVVKKSLSTKSKKMSTRLKGRTQKAIKADLKRTAKKGGKRKSASGKTYYESRVNRSDAGRKKTNRI